MESIIDEFDLNAYCEAAATTSDSSVVADCKILNVVGELGRRVEGIGDGLQIVFLVLAASLVFFMQTGFAMLCAGSVRAKNAKNIMLKNFLDACACAIAFYMTGNAFAYGNESDGRSFIGTSGFFIRDLQSGLDYALFFQQLAFAANAATIICCSVAERCRFVAYVLNSLFLSGFVYPVVVRSIWSQSGFLYAGPELDISERFREVGVIDFAGSGVVHLTGGITALAGAIVLGPRLERFYNEKGEPIPDSGKFGGHSTSLQMLGTFILWFGWYGFNAGSVVQIDNADAASVAALCAVTTTMAGAAGCCAALFMDTLIHFIETGETSYDVPVAMNGSLAGLVAITAGCSVVSPWAAVIIGSVGGILYNLFTGLLIHLKIDDPVGATPVHLCNGIWGLLSVGLFAEPDRMALAGYNHEHPGWFFDVSDGNLLLSQLVAVVWITGWCSILMLPFFYILNLLDMLRVPIEVEKMGLDAAHHDNFAYLAAAAAAVSGGASSTSTSPIMTIDEAMTPGAVPMEMPLSITDLPNTTGDDDNDDDNNNGDSSRPSPVREQSRSSFLGIDVPGADNDDNETQEFEREFLMSRENSIRGFVSQELSINVKDEKEKINTFETVLEGHDD